ncbi:MAG: class I SAM-dependent methyltransferase, partial [Methermicoccaceae archaeon]
MTDKKKSPEEIEVTSFFNEFSERYEDEAFRQSPGLLFISEKELEAVKNFIEPTPSESSKQRGWALDIGVGTGRFSRLLSGMGYSTVGIDLSIEMLKQARNNVNGLEVVLASADMLPFKDEVFSRVVCIRVLKYVPDWKHAIEN